MLPKYWRRMTRWANKSDTTTVVCTSPNLYITPPCGCLVVLRFQDGQRSASWGCQHFYGSYLRTTTQTTHYHRGMAPES
jgi:hypothetical protein